MQITLSNYSQFIIKFIVLTLQGSDSLKIVAVVAQTQLHILERTLLQEVGLFPSIHYSFTKKYYDI